MWNAISKCKVRMEENGGEGFSIAISGAGGGLGHLGVQFAAKLGCNVIAIEASASALALLGQVVDDLGHARSKVTIIDPRKQSTEDIRRSTFGAVPPMLEAEKGVDALIILSESQQALDYGLKLVKNHGVCVMASFPKTGFHIQPQQLIFQHIDLVGVLVGRNRQLREMLNFAAKQGIKAKVKTYSLEQLNLLVKDYHSGVSGKLVVEMVK
jgi:propanol-preferring alcohol dehydrogenase